MRPWRGLWSRAFLVMALALGLGAIAAPVTACQVGYQPSLTEIAQRSRLIALVVVEAARHPVYDVRIIDAAVGDVRDGQLLRLGQDARNRPGDYCPEKLYRGRRLLIAATDPRFMPLGTAWQWYMDDGRMFGPVRSDAETLVELLADLERLALPRTDAVAEPVSHDATPWWLAVPAVAGAAAWLLRRRPAVSRAEPSPAPSSP